MKSKFLNKENKILILLVIIIFIIILYNVLKVRSYTKKYKINNYNVMEEYDKKKQTYTFAITKDELKYSYSIESKYIRGKKKIKEISSYFNTDYKCVIPDIKNLDSIPLCIQNENNELIDYRLTDIDFGIKEQDTKVNLKKDNLTIENTLDNYLVWNYKSFYNINNNKIEEIKLFKKDIYDIHLATILNNYLVIPDYDSEYNFNTFYIYDLDKKSLSSWETKYDISFDSYIAGSYDKSIYLVDKKNKIEYEIVPSHKKIRIVGTSKKDGVIYQEKFKNISLQKLINKEYNFSKNIGYNYFIESKKLYLKMSDSPNKIVVSTMDDLKIMDQNKDKVYFLSKDKLYVYSPLSGLKLLLENFEWNFNYENMIFVYNK